MKVSKRLIWVLLLLILAAILSINALFFESPFIGLPCSFAFFYVVSVAVGNVFFAGEDKFLKLGLGFGTFLVFAASFGSVLAVLGTYGELLSLGMVFGLGLFFVVFSFRAKNLQNPEAGSEVERIEGSRSLSLPLSVGGFLFFAGVAFFALVTARTSEGATSVWLTIPNYFLVSFFLASLFLFIFLFFTRAHVSLKFVLIFVYSFLAHSLFLIVWYPGRYGDPWAHLGRARFLDKAGLPYAYSHMISNFLFVDLIGGEAQYVLVVLLRRMLNVDIYWVHVLFVPLLWSVLVPLFSYKLAELLSKKRSEKFTLAAAFVSCFVPTLIAWGTVSVANSVGFVFFFFAVVLLFYWLRTGDGKIWVLSLLTTLVTVLAHPQPGVFAFMFFLLGTVFGKVKRSVLKVAFYAVLFVSYPFALFLASAGFSLDTLFTLESLGSLQSDIVTAVVFFGLLGVFLSARGRYVERRIALLLFVFYLTVVLEYFLTMYGMFGLPFGPKRILAITDLLLVPFVALGVLSVMDVLAKASSRVRLSPSFLRRFFGKVSPRAAAFVLMGLALSVQATLALYQAYPHKEIADLQPSVYEMEAIYYINSTARGPYVVLCDPQLANLAIGLLGIDYGYAGGKYGLWGIPDYDYPTLKLYSEMVKSPSISLMKAALELDFARWAETAFFVLSVKAGQSFDQALARALEVLPLDVVFGDGKLYVFKYPLPILEEAGPSVRVVFDDGLGGERNVSTEFVYMVENEINSTLTLSGRTSYNVTEFPAHWTFLDLMVNYTPSRFDNSSDVNSFIYVKGLQQSDVLTIKWLFNRRYTDVGWKEDSFKRLDLWRAHDIYRGTIMPSISSDGNVLRMSYFFRPGPYQYYYYVTSVGLSTDDYPYLLMRWRCDEPIAVAAVYFELSGVQETVSLGSISEEWSTIVVPLQSGDVVRTVMVGITNLRNQRLDAQATLEIDYIMLSTEANP